MKAFWRMSHCSLEKQVIGKEEFHTGSPQGIVGGVDLLSREWRDCDILDPDGCLLLRVCKFLCRRAIRGKEDTKGVFPYRFLGSRYGSKSS